jgi:hydrogenase maturation protease
MKRVLVAGVGNDLLGDDGFGPAVVRRLMTRTPIPGTYLRDVGIRALHLAYELLDPWDGLLVVDAVARGGPPGTLHLLEAADAIMLGRAFDGHAMDVPSILHTARSLGAVVPPVLVLGCDVGSVEEGLGLTPDVERAVEAAIVMVESVVHRFGSRSPLRASDTKERSP